MAQSLARRRPVRCPLPRPGRLGLRESSCSAPIAPRLGVHASPVPPPPTPQLSPARVPEGEGTSEHPMRRTRGRKGKQSWTPLGQGPPGGPAPAPQGPGAKWKPSRFLSCTRLRAAHVTQATPARAAPGRLLIGAERRQGRGQSHQYDVRAMDAGWWREHRGPRHCARADCARPGCLELCGRAAVCKGTDRWAGAWAARGLPSPLGIWGHCHHASPLAGDLSS